MRKHIVTMRVHNFDNEMQDNARALAERPAHQMM